MANQSSLLLSVFLLPGLWGALLRAEDTSSLQRLESAQQGVAEGSWPRKPDDRLSPLSGKMKPISEISPKYYGQARQFGSKKSEKWQKEVSWVKRTAWEESGDRDWEAVRWNQQEKETGDRQKSQHEKFQPEAGLATAQILSFPELDRETAPCWSSRSSPLGTGGDGSLRMYEGRLTRVREQVLREDEKSRDLGPERREKFTPREVEEMLSQPVGEFRGPVKGRTEEGSPPAVGGN